MKLSKPEQMNLLLIVVCCAMLTVSAVNSFQQHQFGWVAAMVIMLAFNVFQLTKFFRARSGR